jgi:hypothetical protein
MACMKSPIFRRIILDCVIFICLFSAPWWLTIPLSIVGIFVFNNYIEFIFAGLFMYALYGVGGSGILSSTLWLPIILVTIYLAISFLKKYLIIYNKNV